MSVVRRQNRKPKSGAVIIPFPPRREKSRISETGFYLSGSSLFDEDPYKEDIENANNAAEADWFELDEMPVPKKQFELLVNLGLYGMAILLGVMVNLLVFHMPETSEAPSSFENQVLERMDDAQQVLETWAVQDMRGD